MDNLLDTNVFIDSFKGKKEAQELISKTDTIICSVVTLAELIQGARDKREKNQIEKSFKSVQVLPITKDISLKMLELMSSYSISHGLTIPDALIAATALEHELKLITANKKHFVFIKGLIVG